jgi:hypothetical protein
VITAFKVLVVTFKAGYCLLLWFNFGFLFHFATFLSLINVFVDVGFGQSSAGLDTDKISVNSIH